MAGSNDRFKLNKEQLETTLERHKNEQLFNLGFSTTAAQSNMGSSIPIGEASPTIGASQVAADIMSIANAPAGKKAAKGGLTKDQVIQYLKKAWPMAAQGRWKSMPDWSENQNLLWIIFKESSYNPNNFNGAPGTHAYGLFQFEPATWADTGVQKTSDPLMQCVAGLRYVMNIYKNPENAAAFWRAHGWY